MTSTSPLSSPAAGTAVVARRRIESVDLLRGAVMVIMAIDHVRDYFHLGTQQFSPEDLTQTNAAIFFTRWITHFCAPVFVFLAGTSASLTSRRRQSLSALSRLLLTRGLWLVVVELTLVALAVNFNLSYGFTLLQVIWAIGWSMVALALLIHLPWGVLLAFSLVMIAGHNLLDPIRPEALGAFSWLWQILHVGPSILELGDGRVVLVAYPLIPWIGVMAAGYCFGRMFTSPEFPPDRRRRILLTLGTAMTVAFVLLRLLNGYGDPDPWSSQPRPLMTLLSFLRVTKYPPSLDYLLMTLGPAIAVLGLLERVKVGERNPLLVFGRVPFFYYLAHWYLLHSVALLLAWLRYGRADFLFQIMPSFDPRGTGVPPDYGYSLAATYLIWGAIVALLYPLCLWYSRVKARSRSPVFSYF